MPAVTLLYFYMDNCAPCKLAAPKVQQIAQSLSDRIHVVEYVDLVSDHGLQRAHELRVKSAPTLVVVDEDGNRLFGMVGGLITVERVTQFLNTYA